MHKFLRVWAFVGTQFIVSLPAIADAPDTLWTKTYGGTGYDYGHSVQECANGDFIIAGYTASFGSGSGDVYLIRTDADGDTLWTRTYGGTDSDVGYSVQECAEDGFIIAGGIYSFDTDTSYVYLIRTDANGDTLWTKIHGGTGEDKGYSVQECAKGGFIITGETDSFGASSRDICLIRTNANGDTLWTKTYGGTNTERGKSVQECAEGGFIIAGETTSFGAGSFDIYLIRTNSGGDTLWTKTYGGTGWDYGESVQECAEGGFIIAGMTKSFGVDSGDIYLIRTDADGDTLWTKIYGGTDWDVGFSIQECAEGGFIIAGGTASYGAGSWDVYLIRISETGVEEETGNRHKAIGISLEVYPNPSMGKFVVRYSLSNDYTINDLRLTIHDLSGRLVKTLYSGIQEKGYHKVNVGAYHDTPTGIYFIRLEAGKFRKTKKLTILR